MKYLLLPLLLACSVAWADIATIVAIRGDVKVDGSQVYQGSVIQEKSTVITGDKSFAIIQFQDGSRVTVRPDSELIVTTFNREEVELDLLSGGLRVITGVIAKSGEDNYKVNTKTALLGVRGTEFSIYIVE